jgi:hypothetical protein
MRLAHMLRELELVYQNSVHGNSLATLYSCVGDRSPLIILIEDTHRHLFGCFLTTPLKSQKKMSSFTGTGEVRKPSSVCNSIVSRVLFC